MISMIIYNDITSFLRDYSSVHFRSNKQTEGELPVMMELWGMQSTPSLPSLSGSLWSGVVSSDRVRCKVKIEVNCVLMLN